MCLYMTTITAAMPTVITINTAATRVVRPAAVTLWLCAWFGPGAGEITAGVELRVVGVERWVVEGVELRMVGVERWVVEGVELRVVGVERWVAEGVELRVVGVERWVVESGRITRVGDRPVGELLRVNDSSVKYRIWCI